MADVDSPSTPQPPRPVQPLRIVPARTLLRCARHRDTDARARCDRCHMAWCEACLKRHEAFGRLAWSCSCGGRAEAVVEPDADHDRRQHARWIGSALRAPLSGTGLKLVLVGTLCYGLLDAWLGASTRAALWGWFELLSHPVATGAITAGPDLGKTVVGISVFIAVLGYQFAWFMEVIGDSARGRPTLEQFPEFTSFAESIMLPAMQAFAALGATVGPGLLAMLAAPISPIVGALLAFGGLLVLPMTIASIAMAGSLRGLDPLRIVAGIRAAGLEYGLATALFLVMFGSIAGGSLLFDRVPYVGSFIKAFVILSSAAMSAQILGLDIIRNEKRLGWLSATRRG